MKNNAKSIMDAIAREVVDITRDEHLPYGGAVGQDLKLVAAVQSPEVEAVIESCAEQYHEHLNRAIAANFTECGCSLCQAFAPLAERFGEKEKEGK